MDKFETQTVTMMVEVQDTGQVPITHDQYGATSDEVSAATNYGGPLVTIVLESPLGLYYIPMLRED